MFYDFNTVSPEDDVVNLISIDPSSMKCGFAVLSICLKTKQIKVAYAYTLMGNDAQKELKPYIELYGDRETRNLGYGIFLKKLIDIYNPVLVACEAPYAKFITTYRALVEQNTVFRVTVWNWSRVTPFKLIEASKAKKNMKVNGGSGDKTLMKTALLKRDLLYSDNVDIDSLDEHSIDAICVGLYAADSILKGLIR